MTLRIIAGLLLFLICSNCDATADDTAIMSIGGTIRPMNEHPSIRLLAEHVHARIFVRTHVVLVECIFFLQNDGPESIVKMGFPCYASEDDFGSRFEYFKSYVNGREVDIQILENKQQKPSVWYCKEVSFKQGELKTIRNIYKAGTSFTSRNDRWFTYILHTGASWLGTIGIVNIVLSFEDFNTDKIYGIEPSGYEIDKKEIRWTLTNYEPKKPWDIVKAMWYGWIPEEFGSELHKKAALGDIEGVRILLEEGVDIDSTRDINTPLIDAILFGAGPDMVEFLVKNGASLNLDHDRGLYLPPLSMAITAYEQYKYPFTLEVVQILIDNGAKVTHGERRFIEERATGDLKKLLEKHYQK